MANNIKRMKVRLVCKHDTETNWAKASNFKPEKGELIIYDIDNNHSYERMKIGDGKTLVSNLPFVLDIFLFVNNLINPEHVLSGLVFFIFPFIVLPYTEASVIVFFLDIHRADV